MEKSVDPPCPKCNKGELILWTRPNGNILMCTECDYVENIGVMNHNE